MPATRGPLTGNIGVKVQSAKAGIGQRFAGKTTHTLTNGQTRGQGAGQAVHAFFFKLYRDS